MAKIEQHKRVKLIMGMISSGEEFFGRVEDMLRERFGEIDFESQIIKFNFTNYYQDEMGGNLFRKFIAFKNLVFPDNIVDVKIYTNDLERKFLNIHRGRNINIDPGYVSAAKLVLASAKNFSHRIYLREGIYAEITLRYKKGNFEPWEWTFPDYRTVEYIEIFNEIRKIYMNQLKAKREVV